MELTIPTVLKTLSASGSAATSISDWWSKSKGDNRALIGELKDNLIYLDMVANDGIPLATVIDNLSLTEFRRLSKSGYNFNKLKKGKIPRYKSLDGTDLSHWGGKETEQLIFSIYEKINEIKIKHPLVKDNSKYRWGIRVNNVRKRVWLLLRHVNS